MSAVGASSVTVTRKPPVTKFPELSVAVYRTVVVPSGKGSPGEALEHIAGFAVANDVSERHFQLERGGGQWIKGKSCETFNPCGPFLATPDEIDLAAGMDLWLDVNGERRQTGSTHDMIFDIATVLHHVSQFMVLEPGDLVNTGTPPGVAMGMAEPGYLSAGDVMTLGITGLGEQRQELVSA